MQCRLLALPVELLHEIATYLLPFQRVIFSLTCKALRNTVGTGSPQWPKELFKEDVLELLPLLQRDIPQYRLCSPCKTLHLPSRSVVKLSSNKLQRGKILHPMVQAYLQAPDEKKCINLLYWLSPEHLRLAAAKQICISTLRCSGTISLSTAFPTVPELHGGAFNFTITPVMNRKNVIFHAVYEVIFVCAPVRYWANSHTRKLLSYFDMRCCLHCSTGQMLDEMLCVLSHRNDGLPHGVMHNCVRAWDANEEEGCGHHSHACKCAVEYRIERVMKEGETAPVGIRVSIWQWLGDRSDDWVLRQKGVLRNLYEEAIMEVEWKD
ncbi:hypothetical protein EJ04DRAFT_521825 [Polyplosphaeria fusca]|uniref:F-box domain-containing protein n=1 Tax=Polyplosphaeria fusca TaxID=682080 RepID=A0A9P4QZA0_9PLEO|nr:hypothetical protein EJ04DRAFT_521825 [Polyplosphaeria fusca]